MLKLVLALLLTLSVSLNTDLKKIRDLYMQMSRDEESAIALKNLVKNNQTISLTLRQAYSAAAEMALAKYKTNPITRLNTFNSGKKLLESLIKSDSSIFEIRYIRFTIQQNAPSFLGYTTELGRDRAFLITHLKFTKAEDPDLFSYTYAYLITHASLGSKELKLINSY